MCEDSNGKIHLNGRWKGKEYICDGVSIIQSDPTFVTGKYHIYSMSSDGEKNIWYTIDLTPDVSDDQGTYIVKYRNANDFTLIPQMQSQGINKLISGTKMVFDSKNNPYTAIYNEGGIVGDVVWTINKTNNWEISIKAQEHISTRSLYFDHEDNLWAALSRDIEKDYGKIAICLDGNWVIESDNTKVIKDCTAVYKPLFPDNNTIWVCTSGGVFEFKK